MGFGDLAIVWDERGYEEAVGVICSRHIIDADLLAKLTPISTDETCIACGHSATSTPFAVDLEALMVPFMGAFHFKYTRAIDTLFLDDDKDSMYFGPQLDSNDAVDEVGDGVFAPDAHHAILEAIKKAVVDQTWTPIFSPVEDSTGLLISQWEKFERIVKHKARFHTGAPGSRSPLAKALKILDVVAKHALIQTLPAGTVMYRGRMCEEPSSVKANAAELGPAPAPLATANRMSPAGISLFYASADNETAVSEIAGHSPDPYAVMGKFTSARPLTVLDLTTKPLPGSLFATDRDDTIPALDFLRSFITAVTRPVIPDKRVHIEYAPTQVMTEYMRWSWPTPLDGIVLPSAQTGRPTYVMFFDGSAVADVGAADPTTAFVLDSSDVGVYEVTRTYSAVPAKGFMLASALKPRPGV